MKEIESGFKIGLMLALITCTPSACVSLASIDHSLIKIAGKP